MTSTDTRLTTHPLARTLAGLLPTRPMPTRLIPVRLFAACLALCLPMLTPPIGTGASASAGSTSAALAEARPDIWRSELYPEDWTPDFTTDDGRFLHDFSYAGYAVGERPLPDRADLPPTVRLNASEGDADDTQRIQDAIDEVAAAGGGVVKLGPGTFRVAPPEGQPAAIRIKHSGVVLRGSGPDETRLLNTDPQMRRKHVIRIAPPGGTGRVWLRPAPDTDADEIPLAEGAPNRTRRVRLDLPEPDNTPSADSPTNASPAPFRPGDWLVVRNDVTEDFIADHDMTDLWSPRLGGVAFYRQVTDVADNGRTLTLDIPLRYPLKTRDNARVHRVAAHLSEVGVEDLAIGMAEHPGEGFGANDYRDEGTAAYDVHYAHALTMSHVVDGWVRNVRTFRPDTNEHNVHMVSNGILLTMSRNITIADVTIQRPQYRGGGGNGYGITFAGSDCLVTESRTTHGRHNFSFKSMWTTGNVVHRSRAEDAMLASDFHMHLSPANLFDSVTVDRDWLQARYRPWGTIVHGHPTTQSVFWNTRGERSHPRMNGIIVDSRQFGHGYVIGTQGEAHGVQTRPTTVPGAGSHPARDTSPEDHTEGIGRGETLEPESLYEDQRRRRMGRGER